MEKASLFVPNISCGHCVMAIQKALGETQGVQKVDGDPDSKTIQVEFDAPATVDTIKATMNYPAAKQRGIFKSNVTPQAAGN